MTAQPQVRVLIVDDSAVARDFLEYILSQDEHITVVGTARDGNEAVAAVISLKPDVVTMDIHMPHMDGYEATRRIMETAPVPIIIISASSSVGEVTAAFLALEAGAVTVMNRPTGIGSGTYQEDARKLREIVKLMAEVRMVRRWPGGGRISTPPTRKADALEERISIVAIGASTGGPAVIQEILKMLPQPYPFPILVVQHIAKGFAASFSDWLNNTTNQTVRLARHGEETLPGIVYVAPDHCCMRVDQSGRLHVDSASGNTEAGPSVAALFASVAKQYGRQAVGVLLTGMGRDGAAELKMIRDAGGLALVQDQHSSVVFGMPGEAVRLGAASMVGSPQQIGGRLRALAFLPESGERHR